MELKVELGERSYPIYIQNGLLSNPKIWGASIRKKGHVVVVTNTTVQTWYLNVLLDSLKAIGLNPLSLVLPDGEQYKNLDSFNEIMTFLLKHDCGRDTTLFALGGGVIGDLTGFAAACFQRGIDFIQVPTTLLSQVDSSVGGKTGVNHALGKNMIGAFYQPQAVIIDLDCLKTLPKRELAAGMGEVIKYGIIWSSEFFEYLEAHSTDIWNLDFNVLGKVIHDCCAIKAEVVHIDEREGGLRAILNLGHTFGHAIETFMGYGVWLHGEGVGAGMVMASRLALSRGKISQSDFERIEALIKVNHLPIEKPSTMTADDFLKLMIHDKKVKAGKVRFIVPDALGKASLYADVSDEEVKQSVNN